MKSTLRFSLLLLALWMIQSCMVSQNPRMAFFEESENASSDMQFVRVNVPMWIAKPLARKALRDEPDSEGLILLVNKIKDVKVLAMQNPKPSMVRSLQRDFNRKNYEDWVSIKKDQEVILFQAQRKKGDIRKLMVSVVSGSDLVLIDVSGKFNEKDLSDMINYSKNHDIKSKVKSGTF